MPRARPPQFDWNSIRQRWIGERLSYRQLEKIFGVTYSTIAARARKEDWEGQRMAYEAALARRSYESMATEVGAEQGQIRGEGIAVARAYLRRFAERLGRDEISPNAKDAAVFIQLLLNELKPPAETKHDPTVIEGTARSVNDAEYLRRVVELARGQVAPSGGSGPGLLVEPPGTRQN
jgi:hypothetical protein